MLPSVLVKRGAFWNRLSQIHQEPHHVLQQGRTTYVVKRVTEAPLVKAGRFPSLRKRHKVYETIENNVDKPQNLTIALLKYVNDVGKPGEVVNVKESVARFLILTNQARYTDEESLAEVKEIVGTASKKEQVYSSKYAGTTVKLLQEFVLNVSMNSENPWTLEPWHVRSAFRKARVHVPDYAFTMPEEPIKGPNMDLEGKEFFVHVTINNTEVVPVRCRIHHWTTNPKQRIPPVRDHWKFPAELIFPQDAEIAKSLPEKVAPVLKPDDGPPFMRGGKKKQ